MSFDPEQARKDGKCRVDGNDRWQEVHFEGMSDDNQLVTFRWEPEKIPDAVEISRVRNIPPKLLEKVCLVITPGEMRSIRQGECRPCAVATDIAGIREQYASFPGDIILEVPIPKEMRDANHD